MHRYVLIGQTGVGKSSFVNGVFGAAIARTSHYEPCTKIVEHYARGTSWGDICMVDTPGLSEDDRNTDIFYLTMVRDYLKKVDAHRAIYVTRLTENRFRPDEKRALQMITEVLGRSTWVHAWLLLTFAGSVPRQKLAESSQTRIAAVRGYIGDLLESDAFDFSRIVMIDNVVQNWFAGAPPIGSLLTS